MLAHQASRTSQKALCIAAPLHHSHRWTGKQQKRVQSPRRASYPVEEGRRHLPARPLTTNTLPAILQLPPRRAALEITAVCKASTTRTASGLAGDNLQPPCFQALDTHSRHPSSSPPGAGPAAIWDSHCVLSIRWWRTNSRQILFHPYNNHTCAHQSSADTDVELTTITTRLRLTWLMGTRSRAYWSLKRVPESNIMPGPVLSTGSEPLAALPRRAVRYVPPAHADRQQK